jgi:hypothetical protein
VRERPSSQIDFHDFSKRREAKGEIGGNTALVGARQSLSLLMQGLLIARERNSDDVSTMMNRETAADAMIERDDGASLRQATSVSFDRFFLGGLT